MSEIQLAPALFRGDVVIPGNLAVRKIEGRQPKARGDWLLFIPPYRPDLNPIEFIFAKLEAHLRPAAARTFDALWQAVRNFCNLFSHTESWNYLRLRTHHQ